MGGEMTPAKPKRNTSKKAMAKKEVTSNGEKQKIEKAQTSAGI
jgi:hypothetical protein